MDPFSYTTAATTVIWGHKGAAAGCLNPSQIHKRSTKTCKRKVEIIIKNRYSEFTLEHVQKCNNSGFLSLFNVLFLYWNSTPLSKCILPNKKKSVLKSIFICRYMHMYLSITIISQQFSKCTRVWTLRKHLWWKLKYSFAYDDYL